jgi:hypothetical protein
LIALSNHDTKVIAIVQGLAVAKSVEPSGAGGTSTRRLEFFTMNDDRDWVTALEKCLEAGFKTFPAEVNVKVLKSEVWRLKYGAN